ncbi:MAG TPA: hypothetical protein VGA64_09595 [Candidatus Polarisedimenticolia bacterium]
MSNVVPLLKPPRVVIIYLKEPRERFWGLVRSLDGVGVLIQGVDLESFDSWVRQITEGGTTPQLSTVFFPLVRVEKILLDAASDAIPSLAEHFEKRVGKSLAEFLGPDE